MEPSQIGMLVVFLAIIALQVKMRRRSPAVLKHTAEALAQGAALVDVRTAGEFAGGHPPKAINIPVSEIGARMNELKKTRNKGKVVVVFCHSGMRSAAAARTLRAAGFDEIIDLGPMSNYQKLPAHEFA